MATKKTVKKVVSGKAKAAPKRSGCGGMKRSGCGK